MIPTCFGTPLVQAFYLDLFGFSTMGIFFMHLNPMYAFFCHRQRRINISLMYTSCICRSTIKKWYRIFSKLCAKAISQFFHTAASESTPCFVSCTVEISLLHPFCLADGAQGVPEWSWQEHWKWPEGSGAAHAADVWIRGMTQLFLQAASPYVCHAFVLRQECGCMYPYVSHNYSTTRSWAYCRIQEKSLVVALIYCTYTQ